MGWVCSTHDRPETYIKYWLENAKERDHLDNASVDETKKMQVWMRG
jgi:hypothetical protein